MLSAESLKQIDTELAKYPADRRRSAIMAALRIAQTEKGWLAPETIEYVADYIGIAPRRRLRSRHLLQYVRPQPCRQIQTHRLHQPPLRPARRRRCRQYLKKKLGIGYGETTPDGKFTLIEGECMGACGDAPVMLLEQPQNVQLY